MFNACEGGKPLKSQAVAPMNKCTVPTMVNEKIDGCEFSAQVHPEDKSTDTTRDRARCDAWTAQDVKG